MTTISIVPAEQTAKSANTSFPLDQWYVAGFSSELTDKPLGRTFLNQKVVLYRTPDGKVAGLEDRCCHTSLPLSCGTVEERGIHDRNVLVITQISIDELGAVHKTIRDICAG